MNWPNLSSKFKRQHQSKFKKTFLILFFLVITTSLLLAHQFLFKIRTITCQTNSTATCPLPVYDLLSSYQDKSSLLLNQKALISQLKTYYPQQNIDLTIKLPGQLIINLGEIKPLVFDVFLVNSFPTLTIESSQSAQFLNPLTQLNHFTSTFSATPHLLFPNGDLIADPTSSSSSLALIFIQKPSPDQLIDLYQITSMVTQNLNPVKAYYYQSSLFLRLSSPPDIIISVTSPLSQIDKALQSLPSMTKIKPDAQLIDLRFKHPVIR